jgi:hypothetical protein
MDNGLEAKQVFAFGIDLQSQLAEVQLENRQERNLRGRKVGGNESSFRRR